MVGKRSIRTIRRALLGGLMWVLLGEPTAVARKTNEPIYEDPFDIGSGGASLTRASKEGMIFSNPALLPLGSKTFRWLGFTLSLLANKESIDTARQLATTASKSGGS